ncbi:MAG: phosphopantetheine-binding protein [Pseudomonadota bacterium]
MLQENALDLDEKTLLEKRQHERIVKNMPVGLTLIEGNATDILPLPSYKGETNDIATGGVSCNAIINDSEIARQLAQKKSRLNLNIRVAEKESDINATADIAWIYNLKGLSIKTKYSLGLRFVDMTKPDKDFFASYVQGIIIRKKEQRAEHIKNIKQVLSKIARTKEDSFTEETRIRDDLGVDSLMAMEAMAALETIYNIEIDAERVLEIATVGDIIDLIEEYVRV